MKLRPLLSLALLHALVDGYAQLIAPLWPRFEKTLALDPWAVTLVFAAWQGATSVSQPLFGYWGDRFGTRRLVAVGPAVAVVCLSLIGFAGGPVGLTLLLVAGGLGIGAFHPEAAVGVVHASGTRATQGLALFAFGGMMGLGIGPSVGGLVVQDHGLHGLAWLLPPSLLLLAALAFTGRDAGHAVAHADAPAGLGEMLRGRWASVGLLLAVATLRVVPALGVPFALAFLLDRQGLSEADIGRTQSIFLLSGGVGTLLCPLCTRRGREVTALVTTTALAAACLALLAWGHPLGFYPALVGSGFLLQGTIPILIAYSQHLLPRGRRLAASLTLGTSWGLGGLAVALLRVCYPGDRLGLMLWALVPFAALAALGTCMLPRMGREPAEVVAVAPEPAMESTG